MESLDNSISMCVLSETRLHILPISNLILQLIFTVQSYRNVTAVVCVCIGNTLRFTLRIYNDISHLEFCNLCEGNTCENAIGTYRIISDPIKIELRSHRNSYLIVQIRMGYESYNQLKTKNKSFSVIHYDLQ